MPGTKILHSHLNTLYQDLLRQIEGEVDFTPAGVALFTSDASNYRQVPLGVVFPRSEQDIVLTLSLIHI